MIVIGTAGWSISKSVRDRFPSEGSALSRYAAVLDGVEINSSFYKTHRPDTWRRWADSVPDHFRFSVKTPRAITHDVRLAGAEAAFDAFMQDAGLLGQKLGPLLLQLPPNMVFVPEVAKTFLTHLRSVFDGGVVIEPRHPSWASEEVTLLLTEHRISRVVADPAPIDSPGTSPGEIYYLRLHGAPKIYYTAYKPEALARFAADLTASDSPQKWCVFDNTASGAALPNALAMRDLL